MGPDLNRPSHVKVRLGPLVILLALSCVAEAQIAFVRQNSLYVLPCDNAGRAIAPAFRVCRLWRHYNGDAVEIGWTPSRQIVLVHYVDAWNGPKRFALSGSEPASGISIVDAKPNARLQALTPGQSPVFTPDGRQMIYSTGDLDGDLCSIDLRTRFKRIVQKHSVGPVLSRDGSLIASIRVDPGREYACHVEVRRFPEDTLVKRFEEVVNPTDLQFSPDRSALAIHYHLSRPLTGHSIYLLGTGKELPLDAPDRFAPPVIDDWSPDGRSMLCSWRIVDPNNDGNWIREYVGLTPFGPGKPRQIASGRDSAFSPDGLHVLYLTGGRTQDLLWKPLGEGPAKRLVRRLAGFAVYQRWGSKLAPIYYHDRILI